MTGVNAPSGRLHICLVVLVIPVAIVVLGIAAPQQKSSGVAQIPGREKLPGKNFDHRPEEPHSPDDYFFKLDQLEHFYRVPGEFGHRLNGDQYGFKALSFIITETHPNGGPGLHVHDAEEAHVLLEGRAEYLIGDKRFTVQAPYVANVPAGVPHTFLNVGSKPFNLIAVFASKHPSGQRIGPNPLVRATPRRTE